MAADVAEARRCTAQEYLAAERTAETKHILWDGEVFAMAGASRAHNRLVAAILRELGVRLRGGRCAPYASDQRIHLPGRGRYVYPDASVVCGRVEVDPEDDETITNPTVIVEVLSDSTEAFDRGKKFVTYREVSSLTDYVLVAQHEPRVERYTRQPGGGWLLHTFGAGASFALASLGVELRVDDLYDGVLEASPPE